MRTLILSAVAVPLLVTSFIARAHHSRAPQLAERLRASRLAWQYDRPAAAAHRLAFHVRACLRDSHPEVLRLLFDGTSLRWDADFAVDALGSFTTQVDIQPVSRDARM